MESQEVNHVVCSFQKKELTWWTTHVKAIGKDAIKEMKWSDLKTLMLEEFCPGNKLQKLDEEFGNLSMQGSDVKVTLTISKI